MGIGCTVGGVPTVFHYFQPRDGNPFVLAWWAVFFALYIIGAYWIFFSNGAHILTKYKCLEKSEIISKSIFEKKKKAKIAKAR